MPSELSTTLLGSTNSTIAPLETASAIALPFDRVNLGSLRSSSSTDALPELLPAAISLQSISTGVFTVDRTGQVGIDYLFDGGSYQGELAIFSLEGLDQQAWKLADLVQEVARRALSDSELGHVVIDDRTESARFSGQMLLEGGDWNQGIYQGVRTFAMAAGSRFGILLVPNGTVQQVYNDPTVQGNLRPLFSIVPANPNGAFHLGQIADVTGQGNTFTMEDLRVDQGSDLDYNDVVFQVRGAIGQASLLDQRIDSQRDWRTSNLGQTLIEYTRPYVTPANPVIGETLPQSLLDIILQQSELPSLTRNTKDQPTTEPEFLTQARLDLIVLNQQQLDTLKQFFDGWDERAIILSTTNDQLWNNIYTSQQEALGLLNESYSSLNAAQTGSSELWTIAHDSDVKLVNLINGLYAEITASQTVFNNNSLHGSIKSLNQQMYDAYSKLWDQLYLNRATYPQVWNQVQPLYDNYHKASVDQYKALLAERDRIFGNLWNQYAAIKDPAIAARDAAFNEYRSSTTSLNSSWNQYNQLKQEYERLFGSTTNQNNLWDEFFNLNNQRWQTIDDGWKSYFTLKNSWEDWVSDTEAQIDVWGKTFSTKPSFAAPNFNKVGLPLIGIIDTGFSANNPDIDYSRIQLGEDFVGGDNNPLIQPEEWWRDQHGTKLLEIIAGTRNNGIGVDGINDKSPLWLGSAVGSSDWAQSLVEFIDAVKASHQPNAVINLSFDLTQTNPDGTVRTRYELTTLERAALTYAQQNNILVVTSTGNQGGTMSALAQATKEFDNIFVVGAAEDWQRANYSSYSEVDFAHYEKGVDILAQGTAANGATGTSVAAAKVTGAVSLVWAANPNLNYTQVMTILKQTATDLNTPNWDSQTGAGLLNMEAAIYLAQATTPEVYKTASLELFQAALEAYDIPQAHWQEFYDLYHANDVEAKLLGTAWSSDAGAIASERPTSERLISSVRWVETGLLGWEITALRAAGVNIPSPEKFAAEQILKTYERQHPIPASERLYTTYDIRNTPLKVTVKVPGTERKCSEICVPHPLFPWRTVCETVCVDVPTLKDVDITYGGTLKLFLVVNEKVKAEQEQLQAEERKKEEATRAAQKKVKDTESQIIAVKKEADNKEQQLKKDLTQLEATLAAKLKETGGQVTAEVLDLQNKVAAKKTEIAAHQTQAKAKLSVLKQKLETDEQNLAKAKREYAAAIAATNTWRQQQEDRIRREQAAAKNGFLDRLGDSLQELGDRAKKTVERFGDKVKKVIDYIASPVEQALEWLADKANPLNFIPGLKDWWNKNKGTIHSALDSAGGAASVINAALYAIEGNFKQAWSSIKGYLKIDKLLQAGKAALKGNWEEALGIFLEEVLGIELPGSSQQNSRLVKNFKQNAKKQSIAFISDATGVSAKTIEKAEKGDAHSIFNILAYPNIPWVSQIALAADLALYAKEAADLGVQTDPGLRKIVTGGISAVKVQNAADWVEVAWALKDKDYKEALTSGLTAIDIQHAENWVEGSWALKDLVSDRGNTSENFKTLLSSILSGAAEIKNARAWTEGIWGLADGDPSNDFKTVLSTILSVAGVEQPQAIVDAAFASKNGDYRPILRTGLAQAGISNPEKWIDAAWEIKSDYQKAFVLAMQAAGIDQAEEVVKIAWAAKNKQYESVIKQGFEFAGYAQASELVDAMLLIQSDPISALSKALKAAGAGQASHLIDAGVALSRGQEQEALIAILKSVNVGNPQGSAMQAQNDLKKAA